VERALLQLERNERRWSDFNYHGIYPRLRSISYGSSLAPGARYWWPDFAGTPYDVHAAVWASPSHYQAYDLQVGRLPHRGRALPFYSTAIDALYPLGDIRESRLANFTFYGSARRRSFPRERYYGPASDSGAPTRTSFRLDDVRLEAVAGYQVTSSLAIMASLGLVDYVPRPGEETAVPLTPQRYDDETAPGLGARPRYTRLASTLFLDRTDGPGNPHRGFALAAILARNEQRQGEAFEFTRLLVDARGYIPLGTDQRVLALRLWTTLDRAEPGARVPFYLQNTLGGDSLLRGFPAARFRAEKLLGLSAEYRWEAAPPVELALFADAGQAAATVDAFALARLETSWGFGVRFKTSRGVIARIDVARSGGSTRAWLAFDSPF